MFDVESPVHVVRSVCVVCVLCVMTCMGICMMQLARAFDLGIALQITNICRDVGEDARNGRYARRKLLRLRLLLLLLLLLLFVSFLSLFYPFVVFIFYDILFDFYRSCFFI